MRAIFFEQNKSDVCCLCGSSEDLTGEHKIKASALKTEFRNDEMFIGNFRSPTSRGKHAQSPKSKAFHFSARLCAKCNGSRTQPADREFDRFHSSACQLMKEGKEPTNLFQTERYIKGTSPYLNFFRYFAKLLCCHLAEVKAPRPVHMSRFAIGESNTNCVWIRIDKDWTYRQLAPLIGEHQYAAHGGLVVSGDLKTNGPNGFHSAVTVGAIRYTFFVRLTWLELYALKISHREFYGCCREHLADATATPMTDEHKKRLGLAESDDHE